MKFDLFSFTARISLTSMLKCKHTTTANIHTEVVWSS